MLFVNNFSIYVILAKNPLNLYRKSASIE